MNDRPIFHCSNGHRHPGILGSDGRWYPGPPLRVASSGLQPFGSLVLENVHFENIVESPFNIAGGVVIARNATFKNTPTPFRTRDTVLNLDGVTYEVDEEVMKIPVDERRPSAPVRKNRTRRAKSNRKRR